MAKDGNSKDNVKKYFEVVKEGFVEIGSIFKKGDWKTRVSYLIFGFGSIMRKQFAKGIALLASQIIFWVYLINFGLKYLVKFNTLGTEKKGFNPDGTVKYGDNSFLILLYGLLTIVLILVYLTIWYINIRASYKEQKILEQGKALPTNKKFFSSLLDQNFDKTLLAIPVLGTFLFTALPIAFMICVAFTNYDYDHQAPAKLFTWVGFENFKNLFSLNTNGFGSTFFVVLAWTLVWAFFATFLNYFLGIAVALLINKKGIKFKKMWRTILITTIAVPQFVSLLYMYKLFASDGIINAYLLKWGWIDSYIPFWQDPMLARITIIVVNLWIGIPYLMLMASGILMNIPADLYESATIDGANSWQCFFHITLPYMLFVTGPYLLTQFIGNLNNFNVIYLLNQGKPQSMGLAAKAGYTDLLVTWLYKMTVNDTNYKMAAVIGIMVFVVTAVISLIVYGLLPSVKDEEVFQ